MLLPARKDSPFRERAYAWYGRRLLRRHFARVWVGGAPSLGGDGPSIAFVNHSAWWDPILALHLSHDLFRRDGYGLMQGSQLQRFPFFRRIGCFGATTDSLPDVRAASLHAAALLRDGRRRTLWVFPQGEILPPRAPLAFRSGVARIARAVPQAPLLPVAVRYEFREEQRAECFVRVGEALKVERGESPAQLTRRLEQRLRHELAALDAEVAEARGGALRGARVTIEGEGSLHELYSRTLGRLPRARA